MPVAREGWPYILTLAALSGLLVAVRLPWAAAGVGLLALFTGFFFRDPERLIPPDPRLLLSPADGTVVQVIAAPEGNPLGAGSVQVSIFLSIFDVHVNRAPIAGRIAAVQYHKGEFLPAFDDKASLRNEQNAVTVADGGFRVVFKQIAGLIARRIVFRKHVDDLVASGERVGMIKFGSRVDLFLPGEVRLLVKVGDRVAAGTSAIGERP